LPKGQLLAYIDAIMRVYNSEGRRDNKFKARIKILVHETGLDAFRDKVEAEFAQGPDWSADESYELARIAPGFATIAYKKLPAFSEKFEAAKRANPAFAQWADNALFPHRVDGYGAVTIALKPVGGVPGDMTSAQMRGFADLAERFSHDEIRVTHAQNLVLPHVALDDLFALWGALGQLELANANVGLVTDIIACPGLDYCALATARSIPIAQAITQRFADPARQREIGPLQIKISGCINACGHHHVGNIGILGLEKRGQESYQVTLGGDATEKMAIGDLLGPGLTADQTPDAIERIVDLYLAKRQEGETFVECVKRLGAAPFKAAFLSGAQNEAA
ncbi:MAG: nitrite/sulfite reductase, partial [Rhodoblastus sp.]